jgi:hypothetical protein
LFCFPLLRSSSRVPRHRTSPFGSASSLETGHLCVRCRLIRGDLVLRLVAAEVRRPFSAARSRQGTGSPRDLIGARRVGAFPRELSRLLRRRGGVVPRDLLRRRLLRRDLGRRLLVVMSLFAPPRFAWLNSLRSHLQPFRRRGVAR